MVDKLTDEQANLVTAFTGFLIGDIASFQRFAERRLGRDVYTHHLASPDFWSALKANVADDFRAICPPDMKEPDRYA